MKHEEIVEALHRAHLAHQGEDPEIVEDCARCSMYAEWVKPLLDAAVVRARTGVEIPVAGA